jgi:hypothetical protein
MRVYGIGPFDGKTQPDSLINSAEISVEGICFDS